MTEFEVLPQHGGEELLMRFQQVAEEGASALPRRKHRLRLPLVVVATDRDDGTTKRTKRILLHDIRTSKDPSPNACITLPAVKRDGVFPDQTLSALVKRHMRERMFRQDTSAGVGGAYIRPVGV